MQKVNVDNKFSTWEVVNSGISKDLVLGPLLFNVFMNDIFIFLITCDMCTYADDGTLYAYSKDCH